MCSPDYPILCIVVIYVKNAHLPRFGECAVFVPMWLACARTHTHTMQAYRIAVSCPIESSAHTVCAETRKNIGVTARWALSFSFSPFFSLIWICLNWNSTAAYCCSMLYARLMSRWKEPGVEEWKGTRRRSREREKNVKLIAAYCVFLLLGQLILSWRFCWWWWCWRRFMFIDRRWFKDIYSHSDDDEGSYFLIYILIL